MRPVSKGKKNHRSVIKYVSEKGKGKEYMDEGRAGCVTITRTTNCFMENRMIDMVHYLLKVSKSHFSFISDKFRTKKLGCLSFGILFSDFKQISHEKLLGCFISNITFSDTFSLISTISDKIFRTFC